jgi:hypothetical protein
MAQPEWGTNAGNLGTYPANSNLAIQLVGSPKFPSTQLTFSLQSGSLPASSLNALTLSTTGLISGIPDAVQVETEYRFTVRITDDLGEFRDRTFSISIAGISTPHFVTPKGEILNVLDSRWVSFQLLYTNPLNDDIFITNSTGTLPPGLQVSATGVIHGYPKIPNNDGIPVNKTYTFTLAINSSLGVNFQTYSITVRNHNLTHPKNTRLPVILNNRPLSLPINPADPFYEYYVLDGKNTILVDSGSYMSYKVIGKDFDDTDFVYEYNNLPLGLVGDTRSGWITGIPTLQFQGISKFEFNVRVAKASKPAIVGEFVQYKLIVKKDIAQDIVWVTDGNLGTILNGSISDLNIQATSALALKYRLTSGSLPPNLELLDNGLIVGRAAFQPTEEILTVGTKTKFEFEVEAFNTEYALLASKKMFTIIIEQYFDKPIENVYIKAVPSIPQRKLIYDFLNNDTVFPEELLYRARDPYFGKSSTVSFIHIYGQEASSLETYLSGMSKNHFDIQLVLGAVKTAKAKDKLGNTLYEVVYCEIIDENSTIAKVDKDLYWPREISRNFGPYDTGASEIFTSDSFNNKFHTSLTPGSIRMLHPASLHNMRVRMAEELGQTLDNNVLPKWMTSQQDDGTIIGYKPAWVVCYANPGQGETIKQNMIDNFGLNLNDIDFTVDRYFIDKSATFNWNPYLNIPAWTELPSAYPTPNPLDTNDLVVVFPEKSILPKNTQ